MDYSSMICPRCQCCMEHDEKHLFLKCVCGYQIYSKTLITREEILMGRDKTYPLNPQLEENLSKLMHAVNMFRAIYALPMTVTSGYRPAPINLEAKGAGHSKHTQCLAVDFFDPEKKIMKWVLENLNTAKVLGIYFEDFRWTPNWIHMQIQAPTSGKRIFIPNESPAKMPECWDGVYDSQYD